MNINYHNINTEYETFDLYLDTKDYVELLKKEIAFGKVLKIYIELAKIILENPELKEWCNGPLHQYDDVLRYSKKIVECIEDESI